MVNSGPDVAKIKELDAGWARSYATHDTAYAMQLFAEQMVFASANGAVKDRQGEIADIRPAAGLVMDYFRTRDVAVQQYGSLAVATGIAEWSFTMNGKKRSIARTYTAAYARGGPLGWRIVAIRMGATI